MGAGVADTGGVNRLPPVGLMLFSVGEAGALLWVVVDVVVVDVVGASLAPLPHAAVTAPMATRAAPPRTAVRRRPMWSEFMSFKSFYR